MFVKGYEASPRFNGEIFAVFKVSRGVWREAAVHQLDVKFSVVWILLFVLWCACNAAAARSASSCPSTEPSASRRAIQTNLRMSLFDQVMHRSDRTQLIVCSA